ncbi:MAG: VOC family protein, partial [Bacteroidota bacterium]
MHKLFPGFGLFFLLMSACQPQENKALIAFEVYCEMVANEAKPLALHYPMEPDKIDALWDGFLEIAQKQGVKLHREDDFPVSLLFPSDLTKDKTVVLIYKDARLKQYQQWKVDVEKAAEADFSQQIALARRFGRLLGYTPVGINELLRKNSDYRDLASFGVTQQISHLYYENLEEAQRFYGETLGFQKIDSRLFQISADAFLALHPLNEDHPKDQIKSTAIAFLTDQLAEWYAYVQEKEIPIKYTYKPREGGPHDGFVAIDPGGYLLEFEQFKQ